MRSGSVISQVGSRAQPQPRTIFEYSICIFMRFSACFSAFWKSRRFTKPKIKETIDLSGVGKVTLHARISN